MKENKYNIFHNLSLKPALCDTVIRYIAPTLMEIAKVVWSLYSLLLLLQLAAIQ